MSDHQNNLEDYKNAKKSVFCNQCNGLKNHQILYSCITDISDEHETVYEEHQTIKCLGCDFIHFRRLFSGTPFVEEFYDEYGERDMRHYKDETLYPKQAIVMSTNINFPSSAQEIEYFYNETINALNENLTRLASLGVRSCVERFALPYSKEKDTLEVKINKLFDQNIIIEQEKKQLHGIRWLGNESAHVVETFITIKQVSDALTIIENIFKRHYDLKDTKVHSKQTP